MTESYNIGSMTDEDYIPVTVNNHDFSDTLSPGHIDSLISYINTYEPFDNLMVEDDVEGGDAFASIESIIVDEDAQKFDYPQDQSNVPSSNKKKQSKTGKSVKKPKNKSERQALLEQDEKDKILLCELENEGKKLSKESRQLKQDLEEMQNAWMSLVIQGKIRFVDPIDSSTASSPQYSTSSGFSSPSAI